MTPQEMFDTRAIVVCKTREESRRVAELIVSSGVPCSGLVKYVAEGRETRLVYSFEPYGTIAVFAIDCDFLTRYNAGAPEITAAEFLAGGDEDTPEPDPIDLNMFLRMGE